MIDTEARANVRQAVDDFLLDKIGSFEFDERLFQVRTRTRDATVHQIAQLLWYTYSDTEDHLVHLNKEGWNLVQRLLLVLDSGADLKQSRQWIWHPSQLVAAATLIFLLPYIWLILPLFKGGIISMKLASTRRRIKASRKRTDPFKVWPFPSLDAVRRALDRAPEFHKQRYRSEIGRRGTTPWFDNLSLPQFIEWPLSRIGWCFVSPAILIWESLPMQVSELNLMEPASR
jgi:hypothetical protein